MRLESAKILKSWGGVVSAIEIRKEKGVQEKKLLAGKIEKSLMCMK